MRAYRDLLARHPVLVLLWVGQATSSAGDRLFWMTAAWEALRLSGGPDGMAAVGLATAIPIVVFGLAAAVAKPSGSLMLIVTDLARAAIVLALPIADALGALQVWLIASVALLLTGGDAIFRPALKAFVPALVAEEEAGTAVGLLDATDRVARVAAPALAGALLTILPEIHLFSVDAGTFLLSATSLALVAHATARRCTANGVPHPGFPDPHATVSPGVRQLIAARVAANIAWSVPVLGIPLLVRSSAGTLADFGYVITGFGVGSVIGNLIFAPTWHRVRLRQLAGVGWVGVGFGFLGLAIAPNVPLLAVAYAVAGVAGSVAVLSSDTWLVQGVSPAQLRRVYAAQHMAVESAVALSFVPAAWLLDATGPGSAVAVAAAIPLVGGAWLMKR